MIRIKKVSPDNIKELDIDEVDVESSPLKTQENISVHDPDRDLDREGRKLDMKMKERWSNILSLYLGIFTFLMFFTLWLNGAFNLDSTTLNFLITVGFVKVIGVVWAIVTHLFPSKK